MALRLSDTSIWDKDWFLDLNMKQKLLVKFLFDSCDCAGFYQVSWNKLRFFFGEEVTREDFEAIKQVKFINDNLIFVEDFILFQCRIKSLDDLNPKNNAHKGILKRLKEFSPSLAPSQPLESPIDGVIRSKKLEVRNKKESNNLIIEENFDEIKKIDPYANPLIDECIELYQTYCPDLCKLTGYERKDSNMRQLIAEHLALIDCDIGAFKQLCIAANEVKTIANKTIDLKQMITCYIGILNGKYKEVTTNSVAPNFGSELARITAKFSQLEKEKNNDRGLQPVPE